MTRFFNRPSEKHKRRRLRREMPPAEAMLWSKLKGRKLLNLKFRRQYSVGPYLIDFYCAERKLGIELDGESHYVDGAISTPVMILQKALTEPDFCGRLGAIFNEKDEENSNSLQSAIDSLPGIDKLKHRPVVYTGEVGEEIVKSFERQELVPSFLFVDPFGYKGLSLRLVNSVLKDWGCDCVFFFNYNRISMGMGNPAGPARTIGRATQDRWFALWVACLYVSSM